MRQETAWVTGATGFLGSHFVNHLIEDTDWNVVALVRLGRDKSVEAAKDRLLAALDAAAASRRVSFDRSAAHERVRVLAADITSPLCGVDPQEISALRANGDTFWHIAASLKFEDRFADLIRLHNVQGTLNALSLAAAVESRRFVYVSTAYSCGAVTGEIPEALHSLDRSFCNVYERTKCEAEHAVANWGAQTGRAYVVLRPSIVVGSSETRHPGGSDTGLYGFTREIYRLRRMLSASGTALTLVGEAVAPVNLVPVDFVASEMLRLARADFCGRPVHHLTAAESPNVAQLLDVVGRQCGLRPITALASRKETPSPVEEAIDRRAVFYTSYLRDNKTFLRKETRDTCLNEHDLNDYVREYLRIQRREASECLFSRARIVSADQQPITTLCAGDARLPTVVLCNAFGISSDVWVPLARRLSTRFRVLTWEMREASGRGATAGQLPMTPLKHLADLEQVLLAHDVQSVSLVGWCTGADIAALFAARHPERTRALVTLGAALNSASLERTAFQRSLEKLVARASVERSRADAYHALLFGGRRGNYGALSRDADSEQALLSSMVGSLDPALLHITSHPFRDARSLFDYVRCMRAYYEHCKSEPLACVTAPALVVTGSNDDVAHPEASRRAAQAWPFAQLFDLPEADHFAHYHDLKTVERVCDFLAAALEAAPIESMVQGRSAAA